MNSSVGRVQGRATLRSPNVPPAPPPVVVGGARLVALLERVERPLTAIIAPAGAGKTCALAYWASQREAPPVWIDAGRARHREALPDLLARDGPRASVVVDDAHELSAAGLAAVVEAVTCGDTRVVLASRRELSLPVVPLELSARLAIIRGDHLRLTSEESVDLISALAPKAHQQDVQALSRRAGGWAAAAVLGSRVLASVADREAAGAALVAWDQPVLDYLLREVYSALPACTRHVLLCTAHENGVNAETARVLSGDPAAAARLAQLAVEGIFVWQRDAPGTGEPLWVYHPLLVELLHRQVAPGAPEARLVAAAHIRAALHHAAADDPPEALRHAVASSDPELIVGLLVRLAPRLTALGYRQAVRQAIAAVPAHLRAGNRALLVVWAQERRAANDLEAVLRIVGELSSLTAGPTAGLHDDVRGPAAPGGLLASVVDADEAALRLWLTRTGYGDVRVAVRQALAWLRPEPSQAAIHAPLDPARLAALGVDVAYATMWLGDPSAAEHAHRAAGLGRATGSDAMTAAAEAVIALTELGAGRFQTAANVARSALGLMRSARDRPLTPSADPLVTSATPAVALAGRGYAPEEACLHAVLGYTAYCALDAAEARRQLDLAAASLVPAVDPVGVELVRQLSARVMADEGRVAEARRVVASDPEGLLVPPFLRAMLEFLRGELALLADDLTAAATHVTALRPYGWDSAAAFLVAGAGLPQGWPESPSEPPENRTEEGIEDPLRDACAAGAALYLLLRDLTTAADGDEALGRRLRDVLTRCAPQRLMRVFLPGAAVPEFIALLAREADACGHGFAAEVLHALSRTDLPTPIRRIPDAPSTGASRSSPQPGLVVATEADEPEADEPGSLTEPSSLSRTGHLMSTAGPDTITAPAAGTPAPHATAPVPAAGRPPLRAVPGRASGGRASVPPLTNREIDVLARLARGDSYVDIAQHLFITENTVKTHVASLYRKLNAGRRAEALRTAWALGLLAEVSAGRPEGG